MKEHLRRVAWWTKATGGQGFPFYDIAAAVDPEIRADSALVDRIAAHLGHALLSPVEVRTCVNAMHFAALVDSGVPLPEDLEDPFSPLLVMFERGGGFNFGGTPRGIEVDLIEIKFGTVEDNLSEQPYVSLDQASLDALDQ